MLWPDLTMSPMSTVRERDHPLLNFSKSSMARNVSRTRNTMKDLENNSKKTRNKFYRELYKHTNSN